MKRVISISILLIFLFFIYQWGFTYFKKEHDISYKIYVEDKAFEIYETYDKELGDSYDIIIKNGNDVYPYSIGNKYNKQKEIIKKIEYYSEGDNQCLYPVLVNEEGTYLECIRNGKLYTDISFPDQGFITKVKTDLIEKGYSLATTIDSNNTDIVGTSTVYLDSLLSSDIVTLWNYKGIEIIKNKDISVKTVLNFDKYENKHGSLVEKYYIIPNYLNSKVQEFSSVTIINLENKETEKIELGYTLSSDTYINGIIDGKLYYTDPSNLLQIEINPSKKQARLIGSKDIGGQLYQSGWKNVNIYDFVANKLLFQEEIPSELAEKYSYQQIIDSGINYYFYSTNGEIYRVSKNHLETPILLFQINGLNNFKVVQNTIYFISNDTLYYYEEGKGIIPVLRNNELRYNTSNRIDIYRKS